MSRKANIDRPTAMNLRLPESIRVWLDLLLWSKTEGRVPKGKYQEFFTERVHEYRTWKRVDLQPMGFLPGSYITGEPAVIDEVLRRISNAK